MRAALFDLDRTLVRQHTARLYTRYQAHMGELSPWRYVRNTFWLMQYTLGRIDAEHVAALALQDVVGKSEAWMRERCAHWFKYNVECEITDAARLAVLKHQQQGDLCCIVTAATRYVAEPVARSFGIEHIVCSEIEQQDGLFTGRFVPPLAYKEGKLRRMNDFAQRSGITFQDSAFYSDSITDLPLLEAVGTPVAVNPDARLLRVAKSRQWRIEYWE